MKEKMLKRTKQFAIDCWLFCSKIPKSREFNAYVYQLLKSSSSVGANYRASQRAKSTKDFINKLKIVEEECDESVYWLEIFEQISIENLDEAKSLKNEGKEILSIVVASIKTLRTKNK